MNEEKTVEQIIEQANNTPFPAVQEGDILVMAGIRLVYVNGAWVLE